MRYLVAYYKSLKFSPKSERTPTQEECLFDEAEYLIAAPEKPSNPETRIIKEHGRRVGGRKPFPEQIPREIIRHELKGEDKKCSCCGQELEEMSEEISEKLEIIPAKMIVKRHVRPKYACKSCLSDKKSKEFKMAPLPAEILPKSIATASLFAHTLTNKFCDHLPYYRQEKIFQRFGIDISRANLSNWQIQFYEKYDRLEELFWQDLLQNSVILADETPLQVMREAERPNTRKSWMFVFATQNIRFFQYRQTRSAEFLADRFSNFKGTLATDGFKSYDTLCRNLEIQHSGCWAHTRRKFFEVMKLSTGDSFAKEIVSKIRKLYEIEGKSRERGSPPKILLKERRKFSAVIVDEVFSLLKEKRGMVPASQPLGLAIHYAFAQEAKLKVFLNDANVPIDTNQVENAIRPFVLGRKNWLFSGSPRGADSSALVYSLIETAKVNGLEPWAYLNELFEKLPHCQTTEEMSKLLPHRIVLDPNQKP